MWPFASCLISFIFILFSFLKTFRISLNFLNANISTILNHTINIMNALKNELPNICISLNATNGEYIQNNIHNKINNNTASPIRNGLDTKNFPIFLITPVIAPI